MDIWFDPQTVAANASGRVTPDQQEMLTGRPAGRRSDRGGLVGVRKELADALAHPVVEYARGVVSHNGDNTTEVFTEAGEMVLSRYLMLPGGRYGFFLLRVGNERWLLSLTDPILPTSVLTDPRRPISPSNPVRAAVADRPPRPVPGSDPATLAANRTGALTAHQRAVLRAERRRMLATAVVLALVVAATLPMFAAAIAQAQAREPGTAPLPVLLICPVAILGAALLGHVHQVRGAKRRSRWLRDPAPVRAVVGPVDLRTANSDGFWLRTGRVKLPVPTAQGRALVPHREYRVYHLPDRVLSIEPAQPWRT